MAASVAVPLLFGPYGSAAVEHLPRFSAYGANALWFHGFDEAAFAACQAHGVAACVEFKTFRTDFGLHPELAPIGADGRPIRYGRLVQGVCLSHPEFLAEIEAHLLDGLRRCAPTGIWLDYLTYAGWFEEPSPDLQESCFCPRCVAEFCGATGLDATTPGQILAHHAPAWTRHKCERIAGFAARYARLIRERLPGCIIGAYMCPWTPAEFNGALTRIFAQDYALLAPSVDIFTPLIYARKSGRSPGWGRQFLEGAASFVPPHRKVQLILDALDFPASLIAAGESAQTSWGIQLFDGAQVFSDPDRAGVFSDAVDRIRGRAMP
jgi:hypothetical protein